MSEFLIHVLNKELTSLLKLRNSLEISIARYDRKIADAQDEYDNACNVLADNDVNIKDLQDKIKELTKEKSR